MLAGHVDLVGDVSLVHGPVEETVKDAYAVLLTHDPQVLEFVALSHVLEVVLDEVVYVLAEDIHVGLRQDFFVVLRIYYKLQEQHEQQEERLEDTPPDPAAN